MLPPSRSFSNPATLVASAALLLAGTSRGAGFDAPDNVAVYWGQNSYGQSSGPFAQQRLSTYCANTNIDIIPLAFLLQITTGTGEQPVINLANAGDNCTGLFTGTSLLDCPEIGQDIITCQQEHNKTILLSIGGATYTEAGFSSEAVAIRAAELVWDTFGPTSPGGAGENPTASRTASTTSTRNSTLATISGRNTGTLTTNLTATTVSIETTTSQATTGAGRDFLSVTLTPESTANPTITGSDFLSVTLIAEPSSPTVTGSNFLSVTLTAESTSSPTITTLDPTIIPGPSNKETTTENRNPTPSAFPSIPDISQDTNPPCPTTFATQYRHPHPHGHPPPGGAGPGSRPINPGPPYHIVNADGSSTHEAPYKRQASTILRPFHAAAIDGFDLDLESSVQNFAPFAKKLRHLMDYATDRKPRYLTAAPQCVYPDAAVGTLLSDPEIFFDAVFVQFYNNYCGVQSFVGGDGGKETKFNFAVWDSWARAEGNASVTGSVPSRKRAAAPDNTKVFLGIPAGQTAAGSGYMNVEGLKPIFEYCQTFTSFGGVMMWDASQAVANFGFLEGVKSALEGSVANSPATISFTSPTATTTSPSAFRTTTLLETGTSSSPFTNSTTTVLSATSISASSSLATTSSPFTSTTATTPPSAFTNVTPTPCISLSGDIVSVTTSTFMTSFATTATIAEPGLPPSRRRRRNARDFHDVQRERMFGFRVLEQEHWVR